MPLSTPLWMQFACYGWWFSDTLHTLSLDHSLLYRLDNFTLTGQRILDQALALSMTGLSAALVIWLLSLFRFLWHNLALRNNRSFRWAKGSVLQMLWNHNRLLHLYDFHTDFFLLILFNAFSKFEVFVCDITNANKYFEQVSIWGRRRKKCL